MNTQLCELDHIPSENQSNTTPGHLFCNTYGSVCATEHWAEAQALCDNWDIFTVMFAVHSTSDSKWPLKILFSHKFKHCIIYLHLWYDTQNWHLFKGWVQHFGNHPCCALRWEDQYCVSLFVMGAASFTGCTWSPATPVYTQLITGSIKPWPFKYTLPDCTSVTLVVFWPLTCEFNLGVVFPHAS